VSHSFLEGDPDELRGSYLIPEEHLGRRRLLVETYQDHFSLEQDRKHG